MFPGWSWVALCAVLLAAVIVVVTRAEGTPSTYADLDDGVVWVTNQELGLVGRLNVEIDEIDTAVLGAPLGLDVVQDERDVFIAGEAGGIQRIDVLTGAASGNNAVPLGMYQMAGGVGVVYDEDTGRLWTGPSSRVVGSVYPEEPDALLEPGTKVLVTAATSQSVIPGIRDDVTGLPQRGRVLALTSQGWREIPLGADLLPVSAAADPGFVSETTLLPPTTAPNGPAPTVPPAEVLEMPAERAGVSPTEAVELTAVGGQPVVLNDEGEVVVDEDRAVSVESDTVRLQQVGDATDAVYVATDRALVRVGLGDDGATEVVASSDDSGVLGVPSQPVRVGRCVYGAWSATRPVYARWCDGDDAVEPLPIPGAKPDVELVWRVNQLNVVLNSAGNGDSWADHDGSLAYVGNWSDVNPEQAVDEVAESIGESEFTVDRRCNDDGTSTPIAGDDSVVVRGRQSVIELLVNDDDLDCEPFRIDAVTPASGEFGALTVVDSGQRVLFTPNEEFLASGQTGFEFEYDLLDAAGHRSEAASVSVVVADEESNRPPRLIQISDENSREMISVVEEGQAIKYDVLQDWEDPEGDPLEVTDVTVVGGGRVTVDRNDVLTFAAYGVPPGVTQVAVTVSDGRLSTTREWAVTISPRGSELPPEANDDFVTVSVGATSVVAPLDNDSDPNEDTLQLQPGWDSVEGLQAIVANDEVSIAPQEPGLYRLVYVANDGSASGGAEASILVTALEATGDNSAPVAVPDKVEVRAGRVVDIDVTGNDVDVDGDVLSVVDVTAPEGIRASITDRHLLQIEIPETMPAEATGGETAGDGRAGEDPVSTEPFFVSYRIVDGHEGERVGEELSEGDELRSTAVLAVTAIPADEDSPPVPERDRLVVRAGQVGSVNVLANDQDPDADELVVESVDQRRVEALEQAGDAVIWFDESRVYAYGVQPGEYTLAYTVEANGRSASSEVAIEVAAPASEGSPNQAPELPHHLVRAVRGGTVRVQLPLEGADPDGDPVRLSGGFGATDAGMNVVSEDPDDPTVLLFTADPLSPTTDRFTYSVRDRLGAEAGGTVDVVVVDDGGWAPQGHDDVIVAQPGRQVLVDALHNDTSPQDRDLSFANPVFFDLDGQPSSAPVNEGAVSLLDQSNPDMQGLVAVDVPTDRSTLVERYALTDGVSDSTALMRITPDPNAPNLGPHVADDVVNTDELPNADVGTEVTVDVTANDFDKDNVDRPDALMVSVPSFQGARVENNQVVVTLGTTPQTVVYRATDSEGDSAVGLIDVGPVEGSTNRPPGLTAAGRDESRRVIPADSDEPLSVRLSDIVSDPDGDPVSFTGAAPRLASGNATLRSDGGGFVITPPEDRTSTSVVAVEIQVTDRPALSPDERAAPDCNCVSTFVIRSIIEGQVPEEIRVLSPGAVEVPQLDEQVTFDIERLTEFDGEAPLTYELGSVPSGVDVTLDGTTLRLTSTEAHPIGQEFDIGYTVSAQDVESVTNTVTMKIVGSKRPQPTVAELGPFDAVRGEQLQLPNLVEAAYSPFPDDPLEFQGASSTGGTISCDDNGNCTFDSGEEIGQMTITYTLVDVLGRSVTGTFEVVVKGTPLAPPAPAVDSVGDRLVTLSWSQPDLQGGGLEDYEVMVVQTGETTRFGSTGGTIEGLDNDNLYTFVVRAINDIGAGEWSEPSSGAIPDRAPDPPTGATITDYQDGALTISWNPPATTDRYSAITAYRVRLRPGGRVYTISDPNTTEITVGVGKYGPALTNGESYTFEVKARNSADQNNGWSDWSDRSRAETPSRFPDPPTQVTARNSGSADRPAITTTWRTPAFDGGRAITQYRVCAQSSGGADNCKMVSANGANSYQFTNVGRDTNWTVSVTAINTDKNNNTSTAASSAKVRVVGKPNPPTITSATVSLKTITAKATPGGGSGCDASFVEYSVDKRNWQTSGTFPSLTAGVAYRVYARTVLASSCGTPGVTYVSDVVQSREMTPHGAMPVLRLEGTMYLEGTLWPDPNDPGGSRGESVQVRRVDTSRRVEWALTIDRSDDGYGDALDVRASGTCAELTGSTPPAENRSRTYNVESELPLVYGSATCTVSVVAPDGRTSQIYREAAFVDNRVETGIGDPGREQGGGGGEAGD